jgi:hypothetical protein
MEVSGKAAKFGCPLNVYPKVSAERLPKKDLAGHPRIVSGKIDMGA